jgi:uncharacterized integral membrane protein
VKLSRTIRLIAILLAALAGCLWGAIDSGAAHGQALRREVEKLRPDHDERRDTLSRSIPSAQRGMLRGAMWGVIVVSLLMVILHH